MISPEKHRIAAKEVLTTTRKAASKQKPHSSAFARAFCCAALTAFWKASPHTAAFRLPSKCWTPMCQLSATDALLAKRIGYLLCEVDSAFAGYLLGCVYTTALPPKERSRLGAFYTPPALCERLLDRATAAGLDWRSCRVLDPACGGAAFLAPVALRMAAQLENADPGFVLTEIARRLRGYEVDTFAAWLSQCLVEHALAKVAQAAGERLGTIVELCDTLIQRAIPEFDLVIGNPPYGRTALNSKQRQRFARSLYGHANLYAVFTDFAVQSAVPGGVVAFVTPTSMLGGQYFKRLRGMLSQFAPPISIEILEARHGIFEDVLQEAMLAVYQTSRTPRTVRCAYLKSDGVTCQGEETGSFSVRPKDEAPWILPRAREHVTMVQQLSKMHTRLSDYGYAVSTGPLVWNRHKSQFRPTPRSGVLPVIWAESVSSAGFHWSAERKNHLPYFKPRPKDDWLKIREGCLLIQRTTAKEQARRLILAELPTEFVRHHGAVVVENHLNMIRPSRKRVPIPLQLLKAILSSHAFDSAFRCINGSVAVSAYELGSTPLPSVEQALELAILLEHSSEFEKALSQIYGFEPKSVTTAA